MQVKEEKVTLKSGKVITKYFLSNDRGMGVEVLSLGGILTEIIVPDDKGNFENILLKWQDLETYETNPGAFGAIVGRIAGRIHDAKVTLNEKVYTFAKNNNGNTLHGGIESFSGKNWEGRGEVINKEALLVLTYLSKDGEEGFPGNLDVKVSYILNNENALTIRYEAVTDKDTIVNLTNHAYFNLSGEAKRSILEQEVMINSDKICALDKELIPDGTYLSLVTEAPFDFRVSKAIGKDIKAEHIQLTYANGYDHAWVLNEGETAVRFYDPVSKRCMEIETNTSGVVMYTMNYADAPIKLSNGAYQAPRYGVCFETQELPIGYNEVFKEAVILKKGDTYKKETTFKFSIQ